MSHAFLNNKWIILGFPMMGILVGVLSCAKQSDSNDNGKTIEKQIKFEDIALSIDVPQKNLEKLPDDIRVIFKNTSSERGYFTLPGPVRGTPHAEYSIPAIAIGMRHGEEGDVLNSGEPVFLYAPAEAEQATRSSIALMDPGASISVKYPLAAFCIIGHGIAPDPLANLLTCYSSGEIKTEMRVYLITDWEKLSKIASPPVTVKLSRLDFSKHREGRAAELDQE